MIKVSLVQPNFRTGGQSFSGYWLPYSVGCVYSYSAFGEHKDELTLNQIIFRREETNSAADKMVGDDIVLFSNYMWNWEYNKQLARTLKLKSPSTLIVFGGPQVNEKFTLEQKKQLPYVDIMMISEGELNFAQLLHDLKSNSIKEIYQAQRIDDLDIPSPYTSGLFDKIIADNPDIQWSTTLETNRGCPFSCTFCDWGSLTYAKVKKFPEQKVYQEIEWLGANKIQYIFMADANFGIYPERDMAITEYILDVQKRTGYPATVNANWHKNAKQNVIDIVKKFISNGFNRGMTLSVQSMDDDVLKIIKRKNMDVSHLGEMMAVLNKEGIGSYTELIIPLPGETTRSWRQGLADVLNIGQHNSIEIWFHQVLENAETNNPAHKKQYDFKTVKLPDYVMGDPELDHDQHISEVTEVVISTNTMTYQEFLDNWMYAWLIINFHCGGWSQVITRVNHKLNLMGYKTAYNRLYAAIKDDAGICGKQYRKTRRMLHKYLTNNTLDDDASGHTLFWFANRQFHQHKLEVLSFVKSALTPDNNLFDAQYHFMTDIEHKQPRDITLAGNYYEFMSDANTEFDNQPQTYQLAVEKQWNSDQQYIEWLYFRRRQGFGKVKWKNITQNQTQ